MQVEIAKFVKPQIAMDALGGADRWKKQTLMPQSVKWTKNLLNSLGYKILALAFSLAKFLETAMERETETGIWRCRLFTEFWPHAQVAARGSNPQGPPMWTMVSTWLLCLGPWLLAAESVVYLNELTELRVCSSNILRLTKCRGRITGTEWHQQVAKS
eukprot:Skav208271  [mRNA]  locus=scaffold188:400603:402786:- [translate_table: standard]